MAMPHSIRRRDQGLAVTWVVGEEPVLLEARTLRLACPCAACHDEITGAPLVDPRAVPGDIKPLAVGLVGAYGVKVTWSDGHDTGIYTFEELWRMKLSDDHGEEPADG